MRKKFNGWFNSLGISQQAMIYTFFIWFDAAFLIATLCFLATTDPVLLLIFSGLVILALLVRMSYSIILYEINTRSEIPR